MSRRVRMAETFSPARRVTWTGGEGDGSMFGLGMGGFLAGNQPVHRDGLIGCVCVDHVQ